MGHWALPCEPPSREVEDDAGASDQQRGQLLDGEEGALHVDVEDVVELLLA